MLRTEEPCADCEPIKIGDDCWIAAGAFIGPGAVVPAGTMVKAGEVRGEMRTSNSSAELAERIERQTSNVEVGRGQRFEPRRDAKEREGKRKNFG